MIYSDSFLAFWSAYPRKVGKRDAYKAWERAGTPLAESLAALAWQVRSPEWTRNSGQFIPHPATWLNAARWEDEPMEPAASRGQEIFEAGRAWAEGSKH